MGVIAVRKHIFIILSLILLLAACGNKDEEYKADTQGVADEILENSAKVENILNEYSSIWKFSIENSSAIPVDEMAAHTGFSQEEVKEVFLINAAGNVPNDFSTNVHYLKMHYEGNGEIDEITKKSDDIKKRVSDLNDHPKGYDKAYEEILDMFDLSEKYIEMALNPSGSLQSFNEEKNKISSDILSKHKRIEVVMPSE
jgi:predicted outer membrane protein